MAFETNYEIHKPFQGKEIDDSYSEADVVAAFNRKRKVKPLQVVVDHDDGSSHTYNIKLINEKDSKLAGIRRSIFTVKLDDGEPGNHEIIYFHNDTMWLIRKLQ